MSFVQLSDAVGSLGLGPEDPRHANLVLSVQRLADALELLPNAHDSGPAKLRDAAQRLSSASSSPEQGEALMEAVLAALRTALASIVVRTPPADSDAYRSSAESLRHSIDLLETDRAFLEQRGIVAQAFRAATDAVYLANGDEPPFGRPTEEAPRVASGNPAQDLEQVRAAVLELAQARGAKVRSASARVLSSIADVLQAADRKGEQHARIYAIRFQAERLNNTSALKFDQSAWIKRGLSAALDALDALHDGSRRVQEWTSIARRVVDGIAERDALTFQRAAIQDGVRSTLDAFLVAFRSGELCDSG